MAELRSPLRSFRAAFYTDAFEREREKKKFLPPPLLVVSATVLGVYAAFAMEPCLEKSSLQRSTLVTEFPCAPHCFVNAVFAFRPPYGKKAFFSFFF